jgi:diguanylate cyclase (GGDEF)-like protein
LATNTLRSRALAEIGVAASESGLRLDLLDLSEITPRLGSRGHDLILLDASSADGHLVLTEILTLAPQMPVVIMVDASDEAYGIEAVKRGAQDYLTHQQTSIATLIRTARCAVERHRHLVALRDLSLTDPLTGLYNRRGCYALVDAQLRVARRSQRNCVLLCADLDGLKVINDQHGHSEGDQALVHASRVLQRSLRQSDLLARFGGDEFVAFGYDVRDSSARVVLRRIQQMFAENNRAANLPYVLSMSVGAVELTPDDDMDLNLLVQRADHSLYRRKRRRKGLDDPRWAPSRPSRPERATLQAG